jgi:hypothetical protein
LTGALVLGPKKSGESYAPDESQAIAHLALTVAAALDSLSITRDLAREDIVEEIRRMNETLANLPAAIVKALATELARATSPRNRQTGPSRPTPHSDRGS